MHVVQTPGTVSDSDTNIDRDHHRESIRLYGQKPEKPGLYLGLFHGRIDPQQSMIDWGFNGPAIGPLRWCHTTYAMRIGVEFDRAADAKKYFRDSDAPYELLVETDMVVFEGKYYGDWTVYYIKPEDCERPVDAFRETTRVNSFLAHHKGLILGTNM